MSWLTRIQTEFIITTGDGKGYRVMWYSATKGVEFNVSTFEFPDVKGTLAHRGTPRGGRYNLEFLFQGEDHLDQADAFEASAADPRAWRIQHPKYGQLRVQPMGYTRDDSADNVTRFSCAVVETIGAAPDVPVVSAPEKIIADKAAVDAALAADFATAVPQPAISTVQSMITGTAAQYQAVLSSIREGVDAEAYRAAYTLANTAISGAFTNSAGAITAIQNLVSLPFQFTASLSDRLGQLGSMFEYLLTTIPFIKNKEGKKVFEANGGTLISSLVAAAITGTAGAYPNRNAVMRVVGTILGYHNQYMTAIYGMQSPTGGTPGSYVPGAVGISRLTALVGYGITTLFGIAAQSKQERTFFLEEDSNLILLAHRLYGLAADDSTIDTLIETNDIGLNELLLIRKGRKITHYV